MARDIAHDRMYRAVTDEFYKCTDLTVLKYFDPLNEKNLSQKYDVLHRINNGEQVSDQEYIAILDDMPKDEEGNPMVDDW